MTGDGSIVISVLICDERPSVVNGLWSLLTPTDDIEVLGAASSAAQSLAAIGRRRPNVVLTGLRLTDSTGLDFLRRLQKDGTRPGPPVVVYGAGQTGEDLTEVIQAGVNGVLSDDAGRAELATAVRAVAGGAVMFGPKVARRVLDWLRSGEAPIHEDLLPRATNLTPREREVLLMTAQGMSAEDIAVQLFIGTTTVRTHLYRLRTKLQLRDRAQLVSFAYQAGLMRPTGDEPAPTPARSAGLRPALRRPRVLHKPDRDKPDRAAEPFSLQPVRRRRTG